MRSEDAPELLVVFADPRVMASFGVPPFDAARMNTWVRRNLDHQRTHGYGLFAMIHKEDRMLIGDCGLEQIDVGAELGYDLRSDYWGRGLATEAACAVRDLAFTDLQLKRLVSLIRVGNLASRRVAEKVGMSLAEQVDRSGVAYWLYAMEARPR